MGDGPEGDPSKRPAGHPDDEPGAHPGGRPAAPRADRPETPRAGEADRVEGPELRRAFRTVTLAWMFGVVWLSSASGSHFRVLARLIGFDNFAFGLLAALPFVATLGQLAAALAIERRGRLKRQFVVCGVAHRLVWLLVAAVPLVLPIPSHAAVAAVLVILAVSWFLQALAIPAWMTWMGALVPRRVRGRYFAARERYALVVQMAAVAAFGIVTDAVYEAGSTEARPMVTWTLGGILALGAVFGAVDVLMFLRVPETQPKKRFPISDFGFRNKRQRQRPFTAEIAENAENSDGFGNDDNGETATEGNGQQATGNGETAAGGAEERGSLWRFVFEPLKDRVFRHYVLYAATLTFSMTVAGWFFWLNAIDNLGFSNLGANVLFLIVSPLAGVWAVGRWGSAVDRWGRRPVLMVCTAGASLCLVLWLLASRHMAAPAGLVAALDWAGTGLGRLVGHPEWLHVDASTPVMAYLAAGAACVLGGATWAGINLAQTGIVLGFADGTGQSRHVAASSVLIGTGGVLGGVVGGTIASACSALQDDPIRLGPFLWNNWHVTFAVAVAARLSTLAWLVHMPDPGAVSARSLVRYMGTNVYNGIVTRLFYSLRVFGWQQPVKRAGEEDDDDD